MLYFFLVSLLMRILSQLRECYSQPTVDTIHGGYIGLVSHQLNQGWGLPRWRHQMEAFSTLLALWVGKSPVTREFPSPRPVTWSFDVFFDLHLNKQLSKQSWGWWFETPSRSLWRHGNAKPIPCVPLFSEFYIIVKTHVSDWISRLYLAGVAAAQLRWHLPNMNVIQRI